MKRWAVILLIVALAPAARGLLPRPDRRTLEQIWKKLALPFRAARMVARPADPVLVMPVEGVPVARVANTWRAPRPPDRQHEGQDIFAPRGTPVYSATAGVVLRVGEDKLGGRTVLVLGPGGRTYYYAHLDEYAPGIEAGDMVDTESVLGYVGNTGNARGTPPHLHFGVYTPTGAINPLPLLRDRG